MGTHAHCAVVDMDKRLFELHILRTQLSRTEVLGVVAPVPVRTDPDLEQRRLVLAHGAVARCRERLDPGAGPDQREGKREVDVFPVRPLTVDVPLPERRGLALAHSRAQLLPGVLHRGGGDLVRDPNALELLRRLDRANPCEQRRRIGGLAEPLEPAGGERRRLAHHPVGSLRPERELEADPSVSGRRLLCKLERARERRPRIVRRVALEKTDVVRPGGAGGVLGRGLETDQRRLALARKTTASYPFIPHRFVR